MTSEDPTNDTLAIEHTSDELPQKYPFKTRLKWMGVACIVILVCTLAMKFYLPEESKILSAEKPSTLTPETATPSESSLANVHNEPAESAQANENPIVSLETTPSVPTLGIAPSQEAAPPVMIEEHTQTTSEPAENIPALNSQDTQRAVDSANIEPASPLTHETEALLARKEGRIQELECMLQLESVSTDMIKIGLQQCYAVLINAGILQSDIYALQQAADNDQLVSTAILENEFLANIPKALHAEQDNFIKEASWYMSFKQTIRSAFVIRKIGWQEGSSTEAIIGRAEVLLNQNQVKQAVSELQTLPENSQKTFATWFAKANAFITLERIRQQLKRKIAMSSDSDNEVKNGN